LNKSFVWGLSLLSTYVCIHFGIAGGESALCKGSVSAMASELLPSIAHGILSPSRVCDEYLHLCKSPHIVEEDVNAYVHDLLQAKPDIIKNNTFVDDLYRKIAADPSTRETVRSIHISDIHIDFEYQEGSPTHCDFPICCRNNGPAQFIGAYSKAGKWGDYNCDIPHATMKNMFDFIGQN
jgi:hypothetical protein